jgi:hypothetical protein
VTTISDTILYEEPIPDIVLHLAPSEFKYKNTSNRIANTKFKKRKIHINNEFDKILRESKTLFDCKMKKNGSFEDCYSVSHTSIEIVNLNMSKSKELRDSLRENFDKLNGSVIRRLKIFEKTIIFLKFSQIKSRFDSSFETISKRISNIDTSYWKQTPILMITVNPKESKKNGFFFALNENHNKKFDIFYLSQFEEYSIAKKSYVYLQIPYKSSCSYYDSSQNVFNTYSHKHCIRQCLTNYCEIKMNCSCYLYKFDISIFDIMSQSDRSLYDICLKNENYMLSFYDNYSKICTHLCSIDCKADKFIITNKYKKKKLPVNSKIKEFSLKWDDSKPFIVYRETPVMTFTDYFCYIGGLFGMWFGISANQLFENLIKNHRIYYRNFIDFNLILFYTLLEIMIFIKRISLNNKLYLLLVSK